METLLIPFPLQITLAFLLDLFLGDPRQLPHPVVGMGRLISLLETALYPRGGHPFLRRAAGGLLTFLIVGGSLAGAWGLVALAARISPLAGNLVSIYLLYTTLALRSLGDHVKGVLEPLQRGDLPPARRALSLIVGRETATLTEEEIARAAVETLAENTSDGIIAPLFFAFLGGPPLALAYKAVNTLDSMLGYKNERYLDFGLIPARLDDLANLIPARVTALLFLLTGGLTGLSWQGGMKALLREARRHPSPNAGYPEAAAAGLLGIQLGGTNVYHGVVSHRPCMGTGGRQPTSTDIKRALTLVGQASWLALVLGIIFTAFLKGV